MGGGDHPWSIDLVTVISRGHHCDRLRRSSRGKVGPVGRTVGHFGPWRSPTFWPKPNNLFADYPRLDFRRGRAGISVNIRMFA
jgi:hypothetical protein